MSEKKKTDDWKFAGYPQDHAYNSAVGTAISKLMPRTTIKSGAYKTNPKNIINRYGPDIHDRIYGGIV